MKINFKFNLKEPDGTENPQLHANEILAREIAREMATDESKIVKFLDWSRDLTGSGVLDLDTADQDLIKETIINNKSLIALIKGQLLETIKEAKEAAKNKK
jgi:hypothetical protein